MKHNLAVKDARDIPAIIKKAFYLASTGRPGPVVVDIPKDMTAPSEKFDYNYPETIAMRSYNPALRGHSGQIKKAVDMLLSAKRPVILVGGGAIVGKACDEVAALIKS